MMNLRSSPFLFSTLGLLALSACTAAAEPPDAPAIWSQAPPPGLKVGDLEKTGAVTWKYVGQARYSVDVKLGHPARRVETPGHWKRTDARSQILGARQDRDDGSAWVAVDVDETQLAQTIAAYPGTQKELGGAAAVADRSSESEWIEPVSYWYEPHGWSTTTCDGIPYWLWDGDDWSVETSPDSLERSAVWIMTEDQAGHVYTCNGVVIDGGDDYRDWVLTAAHCLYDADHNLIHPSNIMVCALGNRYSGADCDGGVVARFIGPSYDPEVWDPGDDYALLRMSLSTSITPHYLSGALDAQVAGKIMRSNAYPMHESVVPSCNQNGDYPGVDPIAAALDPFNGAREMVSTSGAISAPSSSSTFHWLWSGGPGFSGAPLWYCGSSAPCAPGEDAFVVSVWSGYEGASSSMVGAKVRTFRSWALGIID